MGLDPVRNQNVPVVCPVDGHVDQGPHHMAVYIGDVEHVHELGVPGSDGMAVHLGHHPFASVFLDIRHSVPINGLAIGPLEALADGMAGSTFRQSSHFQHFLFFQFIMMDRRNLEHALGQGPRLIHHHIGGMGQGLHVVGAFDQDSLPAGPADPREEAERNGQHQGAGAADHQKQQAPVQPHMPQRGFPHGQPHQGRQ